PYTAETIVEDALRTGPGSRLEITVPTNVGDAGLAELREQFTWLADRGVGVIVRRDGQPRALYPVRAACPPPRAGPRPPRASPRAAMSPGVRALARGPPRAPSGT